MKVFLFWLKIANRYTIWPKRANLYTPSRLSYMNKSLYSKTCLKRSLIKMTKIGFHDRLSLNADQKYCRMLQGEHSSILSTLNLHKATISHYDLCFDHFWVAAYDRFYCISVCIPYKEYIILKFMHTVCLIGQI